MANEQEYRAMREAATTVEGDLLRRLAETCQRNPWLQVGGVDFEPDGFCCEHDYPYHLERYDDLGMLRKFFEHGNWSIRSAVQYRDLIFVNQVNGGDEWWTIRIEGDRLVPFESITMRLVLERGGFEGLIASMLGASVEQCTSLQYQG